MIISSSSLYTNPALAAKQQAPVKATPTPAQVAAQTQAETTPVAKRTSEDLPLQAYALPTWTTGFYKVLSGGAEADAYNARFDAASDTELAEYSERLQQHLQTLYANNGLSDLGERYKAITSVPGLNERLKTQFHESVQGDARLMELMNKVGTTLA
ncbi:hypothetical protein [uncultured Pseudomonas sp.]|uniref:hypothetical protein n=1 Tax=uncultured Pseudomonas sp. TaxID=114707 RepID=UPI0025FAF402|nr:hypothetical protein [uncultured Pseudomonas sp.]